MRRLFLILCLLLPVMVLVSSAATAVSAASPNLMIGTDMGV